MIKVSSDVDRVLVAKVHEAAQDQLFDSWDRLTAEEQSGLLAQIHALDLARVRKLIAHYLQGKQEVLEARVLTPAPMIPLAERDGESTRDAEARAAGEEALKKGQVALLTAAGEVRSWQPSEPPRGMYPVGPVTGKTLFCLHAEKIRALSRRYRAALPWIIATCPGNHEAIAAHFREQENFGLNRAEVHFLVQDELPVVNRRGKILLAEPGRLAMCPDGHGGVLQKLLAHEETFQALEVRGVEHLFYFQVDNPLVRVADPLFLGHHILSGSEFSSKAVRKVDPEEKVGTFCQYNGSLAVVEHRELCEADKLRHCAERGLEFCAANIAIHALSMGFLRRLREKRLELPCHFVEKKTPYIDRKGNRVIPRSPNSVQFECFIFDALPLAGSTLVLLTRREEEFSPVKSLNGVDSAATARRDLSRLYASWLREAGVELQADPGAEPGPFEISPLYALDLEELKAKMEKPLTAPAGFYLG